jgi:hypothetical protein
VGLDYSTLHADEFNDWYDNEHIPERERVPGFITAQRWLALNESNVSIATYDLRGQAVLNGPEYKAIAGPNLSPWSKRVIGKCRILCRFEAEQVVPGDQASPNDSAGLLLIAVGDSKDTQSDRAAWFDRHGAPRRLNLPGLLARRSFRTNDGTLVAIYHHARLNAGDIAAWKALSGLPSLHNRPAPYSGKLWAVQCARYDRVASLS